MGYNLYITRADQWAENEEHQISPREWLQLVEEDAELRLAGYNGPYFAIWSGQSEYPDPWFDWNEGNIETKSPDPPLIEKMVELAEKLAGKVQGDDGEVYRAGGAVEQGASDLGRTEDKRRSWWQRLVSRR